MITKQIARFCIYKILKTSAISHQKGILVTYPNQQNTSHTIQNALQTFISSLAACEMATLKILTKKSDFKLGKVHFTRIQSKYNLNHFRNGGGIKNKIDDIFIDVQIQSDMSEEDLKGMKAMVQQLCPIYQMISVSGVPIHSNWKLKQYSETKQI